MLKLTARAAEMLKKLFEENKSEKTMVRLFVNGFG